jgi:PAT family beta-lactamase induction signal transducer AmpG
MTHYAFATAIMALSKWATGCISGPIFNALHHNYSQFFFFVLVISALPALISLAAPFPNRPNRTAPN